MKIYYAHAMSIYGTAQEQRDIETLKKLGFQVVNPSSREFSLKAKELRAMGRSGLEVMQMVFKPLVLQCKALAFRALPDGKITSGVAMEIDWAREMRMPIIELPAAVSQRKLTHAQTVEALEQSGQR